MKKKILLTIALLGISSTALGAAYSLSDHAESLKSDYGHRYELALQEMEKEVPKEVEAFKQQEMKRMESETREYLSIKLAEKKVNITEEKRQNITYETDAKIAEIKSFIDQLVEGK